MQESTARPHDQSEAAFRRSEASSRQAVAATPQYDIWVEASAGSGKTKVLTDRVLRLLLPNADGAWPGCAPHRILCITYTKSAAAQMALRLQKRLGKWAMMPEKDLQKELLDLTGAPPSSAMITTARELFTRVLDTPNGMSIMTIHSFCQSVLGRFPLEAGVTPGFKILDEQSSAELLRSSVVQFLDDIDSGARPDLEKALNRISLAINLDRLKELILSLVSEPFRLEQFINSIGSPDNIKAHLIKSLGFSSATTPETLRAEFSQSTPDQSLRTLAGKLDGTNQTNTKFAAAIYAWLSAQPEQRTSLFDEYKDTFLKKDFEIRSLRSFGDKEPEAYEFFLKEAERILVYLDQIKSLNQVYDTEALVRLAYETLQTYKRRKREKNGLDFGDLIRMTRRLLEERGQEWVHYKLDEGIDHILVDEAQDTNEHQWEIISALSREFQSGWGRETERPRSLFVVGDKKQSIYSFQGADPDEFARRRNYFNKRSGDAGRDFRTIILDTSFRTTPPVLNIVDETFRSPELSAKIGMERDAVLAHFSGRTNSAGRVELWDISAPATSDEKTTSSGWILPFSKAGEQKREEKPTEKLAAQLAWHIKNMIDKGEILPSTGRPLEARDIMILVRTRTGALISNLIRHLKLLGVNVSGEDRIKLMDQIAVQDCLALARFARLTSDNLSLACALKSPFIRLSEDELMELALGRNKDETLWQRVRASRHKEVITWLEKIIRNASTQTPFRFFEEILSCPCPYDSNGSARRSFATLLGPDCIDPLDEFLFYCQSSGQNGVTTLEDLIVHLEKNTVEIKREKEESDHKGPDQVTIMTVHASKGLEAPVVILPDTTSMPRNSNNTDVLWLPAVRGEETGVPLWAAKKGDAGSLYKEQANQVKERAYNEYLRLLYVALTRAKDHLIITGEYKKKAQEGRWYDLIKSALEARPETKRVKDHLVYETSENITHKKIASSDKDEHDKSVPEWLTTPPKTSSEVLRFVQPSLLGTKGDAALSPIQSKDQFRFERGIITHRLFQFLPELPLDGRKDAATRFLERSATSLPEAIRASIISEVFQVLEDPVFADVFGPGSLSEVAITGNIGSGQILSGQIDRLIIKPDRILIVDFKSNRPSPKSQQEIPQKYREQLKAYKQAISMAYPDTPIETALLWTDRAILMPIAL